MTTAIAGISINSGESSIPKIVSVIRHILAVHYGAKSASVLDGTETVNGLQSGGDVSITVDQFKSYIGDSPRAFGADPAASDNTAELQAAFDSGEPLCFDGLYKAVGPFTINGCPSIRGRNPLTDGILITGSGGGITINVPVTSQQPSNGGGLYLGKFALHAGHAGAGAALTINYDAQTAATAMIPNLVMEYMRFGADDLTTHYWSSGVTINNGQAMTFLGNWAAGHYSGYADTSHWFKLINDAGVPAMGPTFIGNVLFDSVKAIWLAWTGSLGIEGASFTDNLLVTNDYGFYIDGSGASYTAPYFQFTGNQTEDFVTGLYVNKAAQVFIDGNVFYIDGSAGNGIVLTAVNLCNIGASNYILCTQGSPSSGAAIKSIGSGASSIMGGFLQNFATGVSLDSSSTKWVIYAFDVNTVATPIADAGTLNVKLAKSGSGGLTFNGFAFGPLSMTGDTGDADIALGPVFAPTVIRYNTTLTADRSVTFTGTHTQGSWFRILRQAGAGGAHNLTIVGNETIVLNTSKQWVDFYFDGAVWIRIGQGTLV